MRLEENSHSAASVQACRAALAAAPQDHTQIETRFNRGRWGASSGSRPAGLKECAHRVLASSRSNPRSSEFVCLRALSRDRARICPAIGEIGSLVANPSPMAKLSGVGAVDLSYNSR